MDNPSTGLIVNLSQMTLSTEPRLFDHVGHVRSMDILFLLLLILVVCAVAGGIFVNPLLFLLLVVAILCFLVFGRGGGRQL
jgi:hypothetical protein